MSKQSWLALCLAAVTLQAASLPFPTGLVPFNSIANETAPAANGDILILGYANPALEAALASLPLPNAPNETFSDASIQLAPGQFFSNVLVPTAAQRGGDYSAFSQPLIDPVFGVPFAGNVIPNVRLLGPTGNGLFAFEVGPQAAAIPEPSALHLLLVAGLVTALGWRIRKRGMV
jgi:hypothetical protein